MQQTITRHRGASLSQAQRDALVEEHLPLVDQIVHQLAANFPRHVDRDELRGAGAAGLVEAAHRYDPDTGVPFARYVSIRVRGAILDETRGRDWATRRLRRDLRAIERASSALEETLQRTPDDAEVAVAVGMSVEGVRTRRAAAVTSRLLTLDRPIGDDEVGTLADRLPEEDVAWLPGPALESNELVGTLRVAIDSLPHAPRHVLIEHEYEGRLLRDIAEDLGVTEARASQLRYEALHALQAYFGTVYDEVPAVPIAAPGKRARSAYVRELAATTPWRSRVASPELVPA